MGKGYTSNDEFFSDARSLIDAWRDRRCLHALAILLPAYISFNGMTDGWGALLAALKALPLSPDVLSASERETIADLRQAAEAAMYVR